MKAGCGLRVGSYTGNGSASRAISGVGFQPELAAVMSAGPFFEALNARLLGTKRMVNDEFVQAVKGQWWAVSNDRAARELGWRPEVTLEQSLADTMSTLRSLGV